MKCYPHIAIAGLVSVLPLAPSTVAAQEPQALARQFIRCSFVLHRMAELLPDKVKEQAKAASAMFTLVGATSAAGKDFVTAEMGKAADAFAREVNSLQKRDKSPQALAGFLREQNAQCKKLFF